jgi:thymidine phosphorylase
MLAPQAADQAAALARATELLDSGAALAKFNEFVEAQGGASDFSLLPQARLQIPFTLEQSGYISALDAELVGRSALALGAGRLVKEANVDHSAGIVLERKVGDYACAGETIALLHGNDENAIKEARALFAQAVSLDTEPPDIAPLVAGTV